MLMDLFIVPTKGLVLDEEKATRAIQSMASIVKTCHLAHNWLQINNTKKSTFWYAVIFENEWFDYRLVRDLRIFLLYSKGIQMFSLFRTNGEGNVTYQPRVFSSELLLDPNSRTQPLPYDHRQLPFEKVLGGWLYSD